MHARQQSAAYRMKAEGLVQALALSHRLCLGRCCIRSWKSLSACRSDSPDPVAVPQRQPLPPSAPPKPRSATPVDWNSDVGLNSDLDKAAAASEVRLGVPEGLICSCEAIHETLVSE